MRVSGELRRNAWILVGGFTAFFFLNVLNSSYSTVMALIKADLGLSYTMSGALMSAYFTGYALGQIPWGVLADRHGSRKVMVASILGIASSTVFFGVSSGIWQTVLARFLAGLLGAGVFVPGVKLVSGWFSPNFRGTALGILSIGGSVGLIASSWLMPLATIRLGWRGTMVALGLLGVTSTAFIWLTLRDRTVAAPSHGDNGISDVFRTLSFWILAWIQMVRLGANYALIAWLPLILREEFGLGLVAAGAVFSLFNLAGMISNPLGGLASDRFGERWVLAGSFGALSAVSYYFARLRDGPMLYVAVLLIGWFINFVRSPSFAVLPRLYGADRAGRVSGVQNTFASLGALLLPFLMGFMKDSTNSYWAGWMILSFALFSAALLSLLLGDRPHENRLKVIRPVQLSPGPEREQ